MLACLTHYTDFDNAFGLDADAPYTGYSPEGLIKKTEEEIAQLSELLKLNYDLNHPIEKQRYNEMLKKRTAILWDACFLYIHTVSYNLND